MTIVSSREQYLDTGLQVLADLGYSGLKLAAVCGRLGVTTGSFYHRFDNWQQFTAELGRYWAQTETDQLMDQLREEPDPRRRLEQMAGMMLTVPHRTESAIRTWAAVDPQMHAVLAEVDRKRFDNITSVVGGVLPDERAARLFASWSMYLLVGYQGALIPYDLDALGWATARILRLIYEEVADGAADGAAAG